MHRCVAVVLIVLVLLASCGEQPARVPTATPMPPSSLEFVNEFLTNAGETPKWREISFGETLVYTTFEGKHFKIIPYLDNGGISLNVTHVEENVQSNVASGKQTLIVPILVRDYWSGVVFFHYDGETLIVEDQFALMTDEQIKKWDLNLLIGEEN